MTTDDQSVCARCAELEQRLQQAEQKARYYQTLAEKAGQSRLRETEALSHLLAEHVRAKEALAKSAKRLRQIIDLVPHMIFVKNRAGRFLLVNAAVAESLHTTVEALTGMRHADVHPDLQEVARMLADDQMVIASGNPVTIAEEPYTDHTGALRWLQTIKVPYMADDPAELAVLGVAIDITGQKRIEESLRTSEQRFRDLFNNSPDAIFVEDEHGTVLDINPAACQLHGMTRGELIGTHVLELVPPELRGQVMQEFPAVSHGENTQFESLSLTKDKRIVPVEIRSSTIHFSGQPAILLHVRDITERTRTEQELHRYREHLEDLVKARTQELQRQIADRERAEAQLKVSLQEKEVLLKEIHHRVKNNLQVISSLLHLQAALLPDEQSRNLFRESQQRVKAMALIHEKLYQSESLRDIDFGEYVRTLASELYTLYRPLSAPVELLVNVEHVHFGVDTAIPCSLIINELVSNALKYAFPHHGGLVRITMGMRAGHQPADQQYELVIADNGIGLPEHFALPTSKSLGLQLVQGLVEEQLNGTLEFKRSGGTIWTIRF